MSNFARRRRQAVQDEQLGDQSPTSSPSHLHPAFGPDLYGDGAIDAILSIPMVQPIKGILKQPKVRFLEDMDLPDNAGMQSLPSPPTIPGIGIDTSHATLSPPPGLLPRPAPPSPPPPPTLPPPPAEGPRPPSLFNKRIESDEYLSETAYILYTKFLNDLSEFVKLQGEVIRTRLRVQEKRAELKRLREAVSQCDIALIDHVRKCVTKEISADDAALITLFEAAQAARDRVGPKEVDYEPLEVELGAEEHKLEDKYSDLERRFEHFFQLKVTSTRQSAHSNIDYETSTTPSVPGVKEWTGQEAIHTELFQGTFIGEQVSIGQIPMLANREALELPSSQGLQPTEMKQPVQSSDTADFSMRHRSTVADEDKVADEISADLVGISGAEALDMSRSQEWETGDNRLSQCLFGLDSQNIFDAIEDPAPLLDDTPTDPGLAATGALLLLEDDVHDTKTGLILCDYHSNFDNTRDRINRWLLYQLRISPRETYALRREVVDCFGEISDWATMALEEWSHDQLGSLQPYYQGSIEHDSNGADAVQAHEPPLANLQTNPTTEHLKHRHRSSLLSNAALAPTVSDLYNRSLSTPQGFESSASRFIL